MKILFPSEPYSPKEVDSSFKAEHEAAKLVGFMPFLFDHDEFVGSNTFKHNLPIVEGNAEEILLRGWMLKESQYQKLWSELFARGYLLVNDTKQYAQCHHFPEAFKFIKNHTGKAWWTHVIEPAEAIEGKIEWKAVRDFLGGDVIIKDYVKSEKGDPELFILGKELTEEEFADRVKRFVQARGKIFNKGLVFKKIEQLKKYDGHTNEWRLFFFNKKMVTFGINSDKFSEYGKPSMEEIFAFNKLAQTIPSNFFTMDIAEKEDGSWMILELGDGQVSGLAAQEEPIKFYNKLYNILNNNE